MLHRAAIIGCGNIAGGYDREVPREWSLTHAGAYHLCPHTELVAVADPDPGKLKSFQKKWCVERGYADYKQLLKNESIDIISLCLPTEHHFAAFKASVKHDVQAIFCEKPLSYNIDEAQRIVEIAEGRVVSVNYFRRWNPTIAGVAKDIEEGKFGKTINVVVRYTKGLLTNGSHLIDLTRWFWGEPKNIGFIRTVQNDDLDPGIDFSLTFEGGLLVYFIHIPNVHYVFIDVDILTEKGRVVISQRGQRLTEYSAVQEPNYRLFNILENGRETETEWRKCMSRAVEEIVSCLKNGGEASCTLEDGYRAVEICHQIIKKPQVDGHR